MVELEVVWRDVMRMLKVPVPEKHRQSPSQEDGW